MGCAVALAFEVAAAGRLSAAVVDYLGKPIASVRLVIAGRVTTDPTLIDVVETKVGRPLTIAQVRETIAHLMTLGRFEDILVDAAPAPAGRVALQYDLSPIHPVARIRFDGALNAPGVDQGRLLRAVVDRFGLSPPVGRVADVSRTVEAVLQDSGYLRARVVPHAELEHAPERATLVLTIEPGIRTRVGTIHVAGTPEPPPQGELLGQLRLHPGEPYEKTALDDRIDRYVEGLRRRGYYEAKVTAIPRLSEEDRVADLMVTVDRGPRVRVLFTGDPLPPVKHDQLVPIAREGSADEDLLEDSTNRIEEYLRGEGYRDAAAPHAREESNGELLITFDVRKGPLYRVQRVEVSGNTSIPLTELEPSLRVREGQPFSAARLETDVSTIAGVYQRRGFAEARVVPETEAVGSGSDAAQQPLLVRITVIEGVRTLVGSVRIEGNPSVPEATFRQGLGLESGRPFTVAQLAADRDAIQLRYANLGYRTAAVEPVTRLSSDRTVVDVVFDVHEGPRFFVDHVLIVGNLRTSAKTILRALQIESGAPLGLSDVVDARQRLAALGLFRRTDVAELRHGSESRRDLVVTVEEAPATTIAYGAGGEVRNRLVLSANGTGVANDELDFAPRASFQIGRRNLFGKNRSVDLFASASLHSLQSQSVAVADQAQPASANPGAFTEYRVIGTYREPRLFNTGGDAFITATLEQQIRSSFNFARRGVNAGLAGHVTHDVSVSGSYQIQGTRLFDETIPSDQQLNIDRLFPQIRLSSFLGSVIRDTRDDPVDPARGAYFSANGQLAGRSIGSEVGFAKSYFTAQLFRTVAHTDHVVLAGQARLGLATGFPRTVESVMYVGERPATVASTIEDLPLSERFFAGGDTTVRGFALDALGVHHVPTQPNDTIDRDGLPRGGNSLVIFNGEVRAPVRWGLGVVAFADAGNVFAHVQDLDLSEIRGAVGVGLRYKSPIGPLRLDWGFKLHRNVVAAGMLESRSEIWISFGQAF
jgi:outer membrane protein assembly complex protein YaeT